MIKANELYGRCSFKTPSIAGSSLSKPVGKASTM